ncbi:MAG TPA: insulinase family protein [Pyrinomonadaceae bacterium]
MRRLFFAPTTRLRAVVSFALALALCAAAARAAQDTPAEPQREQLLNGLPILLAYRPGAPQVFIKLRLNSGAAFDLAGREGQMALLGDVLFPDPSTREFVAEELGGQLVVTTTYDYIDVTLAGRATEFERLAELLRNAVVNTRIVADDVTRLRNERVAAARAAAASPAAVADRAAAARLFGSFPYGRLVNGTPESLARLDYIDLLRARDRFVTADNARLVVIGGVEPARALRAFRQFLGAWRKSETLVPATFRQPAAPDARTLLVAHADATAAEVRLAARGFARTERAHTAAAVVAALARRRWAAALGADAPANLAARHDAYKLTGVFQLSAQVRPAAAAAALDAARATLKTLATQAPTAAELADAKREAAVALAGNPQPEATLADNWLDAETYNTSTGEELRALDALTPADVQAAAARLFADAKLASVAVGPLTELRAALAQSANGVEVAGATAPTPTPTPTPTPLPARRP